MESHIRHAEAEDLPRINAIYNSYVVGRHTSFDFEPWTAKERGAWFEKYAPTGRYQALVAVVHGNVVGFAASGPFRDKDGYRTSVETTIALDELFCGRGLGTALLASLLERLSAEDIHRAYALIALPNESSIALHGRFGYRRVGVLDEVGHKLDSYHSVLMMERKL